MKYVMNKNVVHNGKSYPKATEIEEGSEGFNELKEAGHVDELQDGEELAQPESPWKDAQPKAEIEAADEASDEGEESPKSKKSGKKSK